MELICVGPSRIGEVWPHARHLIRAAIERTNLSDFADIERDILLGKQLLWLAWDGKIHAAAATHLSRDVLTVTACSGNQRERWLPLFARIEQYAKDEGCRRVRIFGRRGWERVLDGYRVKHVVLERQL